MRDKIFKYFEGKLNQQESLELLKAISSCDESKRKFIEIKNFLAFRNAKKRVFSINPIKCEQYNHSTSFYSRALKPVLAFSVLCLIILGLHSIYNSRQENLALAKISVISDSINNAVSQKGTAVLVLTNGKQMTISDSANLGANINVFVENNSDASLNQSLNKDLKTDLNQPEKMNMVISKSKNDYLFTMYDGSKVWLKQGASLSFPDKFNSDIRYAELKGEAYFEITKNSEWPFVIKTDKATIKVLGTEFNLNSNSKKFSISMVSGKVEVQSSFSNKPTLLTKNHSLSIDSLNNVSVVEVDCYSHKAWTQGYFLFVNRTLPSILEQLSNWYEVDIKLLTNKYDQALFNGKYSINNGLDELIKTLQLSYDFSFYMKDNTLYIK